jgi:hypothetical protein
VVDGWKSAPTGVRGVLPEGLPTMAPGPELAATLAGIDRSLLNGYELVILVQAERRQVAHYEAASFETMTELAHCAPGYAGSPPERHAAIDEFAADELRAALVWTRRAASNNLGLALDVVERFPLVLSELAAGRIDVPRARTIVNTLSHLETRQIRRITEEVINRATEMTTGQLGAMLRRRAIAVDPDSAEKRYRRGRDDRRVVREANPDGTANVFAYNLGVLTADRIMKRIHNIARAAKTGDDPRTIDQVRADVFVDLLTGPLHDQDDPEPTRPGVVDIRVDLTTLARLDDNPGEIPGWGPVISDIARQASEPDKQWQVTVTDANGTPVWGGTARRRPTTTERRQITTTYTTCVFLGCRMPSTESDIDHHQPWSQGGATEPINLGPGCRHDHIVKDKGGWKLRRNPDGSYTWTSRHGHNYTTRPEPP